MDPIMSIDEELIKLALLHDDREFLNTVLIKNASIQITTSLTDAFFYNRKSVMNV